MPSDASPTVDALIDKGLVGALAISREIRATVRKQLLRKRLPREQLLPELRRLLRRYEPLLAQTLSDASLAAWLTGGDAMVRRLPGLPPSQPPPPILGLPDPDDEDRIIHFPIIERAAKSLAAREILRADDYYAQEAEAKQEAFTVSGLTSERAIERVRDAVSEAVAEGLTLHQFTKAVDEALGESALGEGRLENVFRTNIASAYAEGQKDVLDHPLVQTEFPYVAYESVHDERRRPEHAAMEHLGIDGTNVYRSDDPVIRKFWPPWGFSCRCICIPLTLEAAAERGIREAQEWLRTGAPPSQPIYVEHPPFDLSPGWQR